MRWAKKKKKCKMGGSTICVHTSILLFGVILERITFDLKEIELILIFIRYTCDT